MAMCSKCEQEVTPEIFVRGAPFCRMCFWYSYFITTKEYETLKEETGELAKSE